MAKNLADSSPTGDNILQPPFSPRPIPPEPSQHASSTSLPSFPNGDLGSRQPVLDTSSSMPLTALASLPTISGARSALVKDDIDRFLRWNLDLSRLNTIHGYLWMAGRPLRARPLHRYKMAGIEVAPMEQMDMHLLQYMTQVYLKPLPEWLLDYEFWKTYICCEQYKHQSACGFLVSYVWLICSPLDLKLAHDLYLLPSFITWYWWKDFVEDFHSHIDMIALDQVNQRYHYGELDLDTINTVFATRFFFTHFSRGYFYPQSRFSAFYRQNLSRMLTILIFISVLLSAMQVGIASPPLQDSHMFLNASYGFVVFSIIGLVIILGLVGLHFSFIYFTDMLAFRLYDRHQRLRRERAAQQRKEQAAAE